MLLSSRLLLLAHNLPLLLLKCYPLSQPSLQGSALLNFADCVVINGAGAVGFDIFQPFISRGKELWLDCDQRKLYQSEVSQALIQKQFASTQAALSPHSASIPHFVLGLFTSANATVPHGLTNCYVIDASNFEV